MVARDAVLGDVLALPAGTDLHDHPLVAKGWLLQQVKRPARC